MRGEHGETGLRTLQGTPAECMVYTSYGTRCLAHHVMHLHVLYSILYTLSMDMWQD